MSYRGTLYLIVISTIVESTKHTAPVLEVELLRKRVERAEKSEAEARILRNRAHTNHTRTKNATPRPRPTLFEEQRGQGDTISLVSRVDWRQTTLPNAFSSMSLTQRLESHAAGRTEVRLCRAVTQSHQLRRRTAERLVRVANRRPTIYFSIRQQWCTTLYTSHCSLHRRCSATPHETARRPSPRVSSSR